MSWKLVRDRNKEVWDLGKLYDLADVLGRLILLTDPDGARYEQGRTVCLWSQTPFGRVMEAVTLYAGSRHPGHLHAAAIVLAGELARADPAGLAGQDHVVKLAEMGGFEQLIEWNPVPQRNGI